MMSIDKTVIEVQRVRDRRAYSHIGNSEHYKERGIIVKQDIFHFMIAIDKVSSWLGISLLNVNGRRGYYDQHHIYSPDMPSERNEKSAFKWLYDNIEENYGNYLEITSNWERDSQNNAQEEVL